MSTACFIDSKKNLSPSWITFWEIYPINVRSLGATSNRMRPEISCSNWWRNWTTSSVRKSLIFRRRIAEPEVRCDTNHSHFERIEIQSETGRRKLSLKIGFTSNERFESNAFIRCIRLEQRVFDEYLKGRRRWSYYQPSIGRITRKFLIKLVILMN